MNKQAKSVDEQRNGVQARGDHGTTFIELLVAIVLLGTVVVAVLAGLRATIIGGELDRDHANAHAWLQSATDLIYSSSRLDCGTPTDTAAQKTAVRDSILAGYEAVATSVTNPEGWPPSNITVYDVQYWDGDAYQDTCYDDFGISLQLVKIRVHNLDGKLVEDVEVVKGA